MSGTMTTSFQIEKLQGRNNFPAWKFTVKTYLQHEGLWHCTEPTADKTVDTAQDIKAKSKLILLLDPVNYNHVQDAKTAKEVKVGLLKDLINTTLESSQSVEDYVNRIMSSAHKLRNIQFNVEDEWLGTLISGLKISDDLVKTKLLQEVKTTSETNAFYTTKRKTRQLFQAKPSVYPSGPRCYNCNKQGHIAKYCKVKKDKETKNTSFVAAFSATTQQDVNKWYIDFFFIFFLLQEINRQADGPLDGKRDVLYVPGLAINLLSVSAMVKKGLKLIFNSQGCVIYNTEGNLICSATLVNNLYCLNLENNDIVANLTSSDEAVNNSILWH
ncbi:hypothetical protein K1T71_012650 [Dendrolimus kikuchii]|uniref:Uncharacterized protein n=1 Tax=Dendrolimus kikuchii TaxID=765133 RepID=A0ACC1CJZ1_9NEOP|nr:hypothetical protein K1T71_012650 [Dendrolimus kikuchii]